jgi:nucleotide-binding universal stress UspA family protein
MKILVGYDGSSQGKEALRLARERAKVYEASVEVVFSMAQNRDLKYLDIQRVEHMMQREIKNIFSRNGIPYKAHVVITKSSPGEALVEFAKQHKIDEIIVGVKPKSKTKKIFFGSTAQCVILEASCPVVTIK